MDVDWTTDELWRQERSNFGAHLAMMFHFLEREGVAVDAFVQFVGERSAQSWEGTEGAADFMEGILLNVRSNGHDVLEAATADGTARALVTGIVHYETMEFFGVPRERADVFWDKFEPLARALGLRFSWRPAGEGRYEIEVTE